MSRSTADLLHTVQEAIEETSSHMPEGTYLKVCDAMKLLFERHGASAVAAPAAPAALDATLIQNIQRAVQGMIPGAVARVHVERTIVPNIARMAPAPRPARAAPAERGHRRTRSLRSLEDGTMLRLDPRPFGDDIVFARWSRVRDRFEECDEAGTLRLDRHGDRIDWSAGQLTQFVQFHCGGRRPSNAWNCVEVRLPSGAWRTLSQHIPLQ